MRIQLVYLLTAMILCSYQSIHTLSFNQTPIKDLIKPDDSLVFIPTHTHNTVLKLCLKNNNITIYTSPIDPQNDVWSNLNPQDKKKLSVHTDNYYTLSTIVHYQHSQISALETIGLEGKELVYLENVILESPTIVVKSKDIRLMLCTLTNANTLYLATNDPDADIDIIKITFVNNTEYPTLMLGNNNRELCDLIFTNVQQIELTFNKQAFE